MTPIPTNIFSLPSNALVLETSQPPHRQQAVDYARIEIDGVLHQAEIVRMSDGTFAARVPVAGQPGKYRVYDAQALKMKPSQAGNLEAVKRRVCQLMQPDVAGISLPAVAGAKQQTVRQKPRADEDYRPGDRVVTPWGVLIYEGRLSDGLIHMRSRSTSYKVSSDRKTPEQIRNWALWAVGTGAIQSELYAESKAPLKRASIGRPSALDLDLMNPEINSQATRRLWITLGGVNADWVQNNAGLALFWAKQLGLPIHDRSRVRLLDTAAGGQAWAIMNLGNVGLLGSQSSLNIPSWASQAFRDGYARQARKMAINDAAAWAVQLVSAKAALRVGAGVPPSASLPAGVGGSLRTVGTLFTNEEAMHAYLASGAVTYGVQLMDNWNARHRGIDLFKLTAPQQQELLLALGTAPLIGAAGEKLVEPVIKTVQTAWLAKALGSTSRWVEGHRLPEFMRSLPASARLEVLSRLSLLGPKGSLAFFKTLEQHQGPKNLGAALKRMGIVFTVETVEHLTQHYVYLEGRRSVSDRMPPSIDGRLR